MGLYGDGSGAGAVTVGNYSVPRAGSISFWIKAHALNTGRQRFLASDDDFEGFLNDPDDLVSNWEEGGTTQTYFDSMSQDVLYHVVCTWDPDDGTIEAQIYIDGQLEDTDDVCLDTSINAVIYMFDRPGQDDPTDADLHDIRLYDRVLSAAEIQTIYAAAGADDIVHSMTSRWTMFEGAPGATVSGTGVVKNIGSDKNDWSSTTGAPDYVYDTHLTVRRR